MTGDCCRDVAPLGKAWWGVSFHEVHKHIYCRDLALLLCNVENALVAMPMHNALDV